MQTGSVLTLNFYSNPIDVMIGDDQTIYLNWKHYCDMIGCDPEVAPHNFVVGEFDVAYIAFSYAVLHADRLLVDVEDRLFADLVREEFAGYIIKELGLIREMLPMISLPYHMYDAGIFQHGDKMFVLVDKLKKFTNQIEPHLPHDVPRFPIMIKVSMPRTGFIEFGGRPQKDETAYPTWMVEMDSLPYIIESTYHNHPPFRSATNDKPYRLSLKLPMDSDLGKKIRELDPKQRFDSPGVVGTHSCQVVANTQSNMIEVHEDQKVNIGKVLFGEDEAMTWAGSGMQCKPEL